MKIVMEEIRRLDEKCYVEEILFTRLTIPYAKTVSDYYVGQDEHKVYITPQKGNKIIFPKDCSLLFKNLYKLKTITDNDCIIDTSEVEDMFGMFWKCESLKNIDSLANWNVSNVKIMNGMFRLCRNLENIDSLGNWNVSNVENMLATFSFCTSLRNIDSLANWDVTNVTSMKNMFVGCVSLENIDGLKNWNVANLKDINNMFFGCFLLADDTSIRPLVIVPSTKGIINYQSIPLNYNIRSR